jgi:hypothetical protein
MTTLEMVREALRNATEGGHAEALAAMTDEQLTDDLMDCDSDVACCRRDHVLKAVSRIRGDGDEGRST